MFLKIFKFSILILFYQINFIQVFFRDIISKVIEELIVIKTNKSVLINKIIKGFRQSKEKHAMRLFSINRLLKVPLGDVYLLGLHIQDGGCQKHNMCMSK